MMAETKYDLLLKGGKLFDSRNKMFISVDVGIHNGMIVDVEKALDPRSASEVIHINRKMLLPGFVDLHTHVYWGATPLGINPNKLAPKSGVTTWLDFGSAGAGNFEGLVCHVIRRSQVRIKALLNLSFIGLASVGKTQLRFGELFDLRLADALAVIESVQRFPEVIKGIKLRLGATCSGENGLPALKLAAELGKSLEIPVAVHATAPPPALKEVLSRLKQGDIFTHCFAGNPLSKILTRKGTIKPEVLKARERGVLFDLGHGAGSFSFEVAERAIEEGFLPDTVSSDIHAYNVNGPVFDFPTTLSKLVLLGVPLEEVIYRATYVPAHFLNMHQEVGSIEVGKKADFVIADWSTKPLPLYDVEGHCRQGKKLIVEKTFLEGEELRVIEDDRVEGKWKPGLFKEFKG